MYSHLERQGVTRVTGVTQGTASFLRYPRISGIIDGVSSDVNIPLSVSPKLAYAPCT